MSVRDGGRREPIDAPGRAAGVSTLSWFGLASGILALAGILALLVGLGRSPALAPALPADYFRVALVGHVDLLQLVWYLVMAAVLWRQLGLLRGRLERTAFAVMAAGVAGVVVPSVSGLGRPVMSDYIPFLAHPLFVGGLGVFFLGVALAAAQAAMSPARLLSPTARAGASAALCVVGALLALAVLAVRSALSGQGLTEASLARVFWVGGHLLQFALTALMAAAWGVLLAELGAARADLACLASAVHLYTAGIAVGLAGSLLLRLEALAGRDFLTPLKSWGIGIPSALVLVLVARMWWAARRQAADAGARAWHGAVGAGMMVLIGGGAVAVLGDLGPQTTLIPGHYHAALTAVAIAFMGLSYLVLVRGGARLPWPRLAALQPWLYGAGTVALVAGMVWAGSHGAARKTPGVTGAGDAGAAALGALNLWSAVGVPLAVAGGVFYLLIVAAALYRWRAGDPGARPAGPGAPAGKGRSL